MQVQIHSLGSKLYFDLPSFFHILGEIGLSYFHTHSNRKTKIEYQYAVIQKNCSCEHAVPTGPDLGNERR